VVRTPEGRILLIVPYSAWFGWAGFLPGRRPVAVPVEKVAMLGRQVAALDMSREEFEKAPTWVPSGAKPVSRNDVIQVALTKR
jgi:hypothetical protein